MYAINPAVPEDSVLLSLPFGGAILQQVGVAEPEIEAIIEDVRRIHTQQDDDEDDAEEDGLSDNGGGKTLESAAVPSGSETDMDAGISANINDDMTRKVEQVVEEAIRKKSFEQPAAYSIISSASDIDFGSSLPPPVQAPLV
ncbi:hypothetical protein EON65_05030 [archaeon]|nr:MAG: hypothetical protein EON65_05030 [archaeon]